MRENLSPEVWTRELAGGPDRRRRTSRRSEDEPEAALPRAGEVLREIILMLVVHALAAMLVLSIVKALGIR
jgi:hypothetical protein